VIELLIEDNLTLDKIAEQERVPRCNINLVLRGLLAEGRITKKQKLRQAQRLEVANIKKQVVEFLSQNPTATNDQVVKAVPGFKNTRHIKNTRSELAIHTGQRNEISIRYVVIKASRAAGVTLEELAKIFGITRERVRQIEASKSFNAIDFSLGDDAG
jgi:predicted ThiF/HesA family dinucleotide-utilizing enzyme